MRALQVGRFRYRLLGSVFDRTNETIPTSRERLDKSRIFGRVAQCFANAINGAVQVVVEIDEAVWPKTLLQLLARDDRAWLFQQNGKYFERLTAELELEAVFAQFSGIEVKLEGREANYMGGLDSLLHPQNTSIRECRRV